MTEEARNICVFRDVLSTCNINKELENKHLSETQKVKIGSSSKEQKDNFALPDAETLYSHKDCYANYTSKQKIKRHLDKQKKKHPNEESSTPAKRLRR